VQRPASPQQVAECLLQLAMTLRGQSRPPRDVFLAIAATALVGADTCRERDGAAEPERRVSESGPRLSRARNGK
jgi:hypothetical protein